MVKIITKVMNFKISQPFHASASDGLETAVTNHNHSEQSRCISATFLF